MHRKTSSVLVIALMIALMGGVATAIKPEVGILVTGLAVLIVLALVLPLNVIVNLVIVASFCSRIDVLALGFHVRPEHVTAALLLLKILFSHQTKRVGSNGSRAVLAMSVVVILNVIATLIYSPEKKVSFDIVGWLFMDTVLLWSLLHVPEAMLRRAVLRTGLFLALVTGILAIAFWGLAEGGGILIGVQPDPAYGGYAAYVLSSEANIAAGLLVLWGLIALASLRSGEPVTWVNKAAAVVCPLALVATDTRAAIIAYLAGAALLAARGGALRLRHLAVGALIVLIGVAVLSLGGQSGNLGHTASKLSDISLRSGDGAVRLEGASAAVHDMGEQQIVLGLGTNSFGQRHFDPTRPGLEVPGYLGILPLQIVYDAGALALLCVLLVLLLALPKSRRGRSLGYAMAVAYLLISLATSPFWFSFTWIFVALGVLQGELKPIDGLNISRSKLIDTPRRVSQNLGHLKG